MAETRSGPFEIYRRSIGNRPATVLFHHARGKLPQNERGGQDHAGDVVPRLPFHLKERLLCPGWRVTNQDVELAIHLGNEFNRSFQVFSVADVSQDSGSLSAQALNFVDNLVDPLLPTVEDENVGRALLDETVRGR